MSFFEDASLVLIPSAYKDQKIYSVKPTDGTGDLTFSRASSATRVASNGLIEKVRTNLVPNGLLFTASTGVLYTTITSDSPISGVSSTRITKNEASGTLQYGVQTCSTPTIASNTIHTLSGFFKYDGFNTTTSIESNDGSQWSGTFVQNIDIASTGITLQAPTNCTSKITNVGNGWYRVDVTIAVGTVTTGGPVTYLLKVDSALSTGQGFLTAAPQLETGDIATDYIATTTAAVSVGPVSGLPRLDYLGSTCPKLLLEPQRTNSVTFSEQMDNAAWTKLQASITANSIVSPDGYTNADTLTADGTSNEHQLRSTGIVTLTSGTTYTTSIFVKAGTNNFVQFIGSGSIYSATTYANFNVATGVVGDVGASTTASIVNYGNGWYRCSMTALANATSSTNTFLFNIVTSNTAIRGESNTLSTDVYVYGATIEAGAYATSYIPTLGASVTRVADAASKTSASALIGQTEGTIFWEFEFTTSVATNHEALLNIDGGSFSNTIYIQKGGSGSINAEMYVGGVAQAAFTISSQPAGTYKAAIGYANNNTAFFLNGVQIGTTDTSCSVPAMSRIQLGNGVFGPSTDKTAQLLLFPTRLTNAQLAELTA
jgi:hypothetical protein